MTKQEMIDEIMDNFDFGKVAKVMDFLDWKWAMVGMTSQYCVPEEPEIRKEARGRLSKVYDHAVGQGRKYETATGGFWYSYDPQHSILNLDFKLATWDAYPNDHSESFF